MGKHAYIILECAPITLDSNAALLCTWLNENVRSGNKLLHQLVSKSKHKQNSYLDKLQIVISVKHKYQILEQIQIHVIM